VHSSCCLLSIFPHTLLGHEWVWYRTIPGKLFARSPPFASLCEVYACIETHVARASSLQQHVLHRHLHTRVWMTAQHAVIMYCVGSTLVDRRPRDPRLKRLAHDRSRLREPRFTENYRPPNINPNNNKPDPIFTMLATNLTTHTCASLRYFN
jgi:hypothetical protein